MNKQEFVALLGKRLKSVYGSDVDERISFYCEIIDDKIEEGLSEEDAIAEIGSVDDVVAQITADYAPPMANTKESMPKKSRNAWETTLLIAGSPVWGSILIAMLAVEFSVWVSMWAVVVSFWAVTFSMFVCAVACIVASVLSFIFAEGGLGLLMLSACFICAGLALFMLYGTLNASKGMVIFTKFLMRATKRCFTRRKA